MRRVLVVLLVASMAGSGAHAASAQAKDPFRPPINSGPEIPGDTGSVEPGVARPADPSSPRDLARTGQDVSSPFAAGLVLLAFGLGIRSIELAARRPRRARLGRAGPRPGAA